MKVLTVGQIDTFILKYPLLREPVDDVREVSGAYGIPSYIHIGVKRIDEMLPHFVGYPTLRTSWVIGDGIFKGLQGTEETRMYWLCSDWPRPDTTRGFHEWEPGEEQKLGNLLEGAHLDYIPYIIIERCYRWFTYARRPGDAVGRTPMKAINVSFVIFLPPKRDSVSAVFGRAHDERWQGMRREYVREELVPEPFILRNGIEI